MSHTVDEIRTDGLVVHAPRWDASALELVCGLANAGGGYLLVPSSHKDYLSSKRKARKSFVAIPDDVMEQLRLQCAATPVMEGSEFFLELEIPAATEPLSLHGIFWLYIDGRNTRQSYESLFRHWQDEAATPWELKVLPYVEQDDLSSDALLSVASIPLANIDDAKSLTDTVRSRIEHIGLVHPRTKKLLNVGALLLCANPARFIPGASIHIASFDDSGHPTGVEDDVVGPLVFQIDEAMRLVEEKYLPSISKAKSFTTRCPPANALREAISNAVLHKDYASGVPVRITINPHQIVVQNVGSAPDGWTEEDMLGAHAPHFRNPVLVTTARLLNIATAWGNGIKKMTDECREADAVVPSFDLSPNHTAVTFALPASKRGAAALKKIADARESASPEGGGPGQGSRQKTFAERSIAAANKLDLTQTDEYVLQILTTNGRATARRIAQVLGVSERTVRRSFKKLREEGFIERIGSDKAGYWSIVD